VNSQDIRLTFQYYSQTSWPEEIFPDVNSDAVVNALDIGEISLKPTKCTQTPYRKLSFQNLSLM
ncbi:MAG: hypothetical protein ACFE96_06495, partial [Candidatus Hermodarchaeota archaeon]